MFESDDAGCEGAAGVAGVSDLDSFRATVGAGDDRTTSFCFRFRTRRLKVGSGPRGAGAALAPASTATAAGCSRLNNLETQPVRRSKISSKNKITAATSNHGIDFNVPRLDLKFRPRLRNFKAFLAAARRGDLRQSRRAAARLFGRKFRRIRQAHRRECDRLVRREFPPCSKRFHGHSSESSLRADRRFSNRAAVSVCRAASRPLRAEFSRAAMRKTDPLLRSGSRCSWMKHTPSRTSSVSN